MPDSRNDRAKRTNAYGKIIRVLTQAIEAARSIDNNILCDKIAEDLAYANEQFRRSLQLDLRR